MAHFKEETSIFETVVDIFVKKIVQTFLETSEFWRFSSKISRVIVVSILTFKNGIKWREKKHRTSNINLQGSGKLSRWKIFFIFSVRHLNSLPTFENIFEKKWTLFTNSQQFRICTIIFSINRFPFVTPWSSKWVEDCALYIQYNAMFISVFAFEGNVHGIDSKKSSYGNYRNRGWRSYGACRGVIDTQRAPGRFVAVN